MKNEIKPSVPQKINLDCPVCSVIMVQFESDLAHFTCPICKSGFNLSIKGQKIHEKFCV